MTYSTCYRHLNMMHVNQHLCITGYNQNIERRGKCPAEIPSNTLPGSQIIRQWLYTHPTGQSWGWLLPKGKLTKESSSVPHNGRMLQSASPFSLQVRL